MKLPLVEERGELVRWLACGAIVVLMHGAVAAAMIHHDPDDAADATAALVVDLAPFPVSPPETATELPPGPPQVQAEAAPQTPVEEVKEQVEKRVETDRSQQEVQPELAPAINPEVALAAMPPKQEQAIPQESQLPAPDTTAPPEMPALAPAEVAAAPEQGTPTKQDVNVIPTWRSAVVRILERNKRYPNDAHNARGTTHVAFSLDRRGHVVSSRIMAGSGSAVLDRAALDLIARSQPFPPPPAALAGSEIHLTVPVRFNTR